MGLSSITKLENIMNLEMIELSFFKFLNLIRYTIYKRVSK